ncbi:50S ribosomal protein L31e [Candidatus Woesearchaeota archaeon]|nr:50S ribosomal protein L31e [Candidatus Woesearchaeota archaeon]
MMVELKRTYIIPLRKAFLRVPRYTRAKRAANAVRAFLLRHMKGDVKIGRHLNEFLWKQGIRNPPHHVKVDCVKDDKNIVKAELAGFVYEEKKAPEEKGKLQETLELLKGKKEEKTEEVKAEPAQKAEAPKEEKKEKKPRAKTAKKEA